MKEISSQYPFSESRKWKNSSSLRTSCCLEINQIMSCELSNEEMVILLGQRDNFLLAKW